MATTIGFKRATFFIYDKDDNVKKTYVVEGKNNEGGTVTASVSGLSAEAVKTYASNIPYFVHQQGTGEVELTLSVLDLPVEVSNTLLGYEEDDDGITWGGEDVKAPYAGILMESNVLSGEPYFFGLLKGKFALDEESFETNEETVGEPEPDELTGSFVAVDGKVFARAKGEDKRQGMLSAFDKIGNNKEEDEE